MLDKNSMIIKYFPPVKRERAMKDRTHDEAMAEMYREDPAYALQLLDSILEDGDQGELLTILRQMAKVFDGGGGRAHH